MMIGLIGKKLGMTQIFNEQGQQVPCTVIEAPPNAVLQVTDGEKNGVASVQLGFGAKRVRKEANGKGRIARGSFASRAETGHAAKAGLEAPPEVLRSFRLD